MWPLKGLDNRGSDNLGTTVVTLLTCSCKLVHCGAPGCSDCFAVALEVHVLVEICKKILFMLLDIPTETSVCFDLPVVCVHITICLH